MPDDIAKLSRLPNPSRMLLADESAEAYDALLAEYIQDLRPVGALERRQVELILRCDLDIDRQLRMIAQHLNPLGEEVNRGAEVVRDLLRRSLMHPSALEKLDEEEGRIPPAEPPLPPEGDGRLTATHRPTIRPAGGAHGNPPARSGLGRAEAPAGH
ncbi:hypothetical protein UM181_05010 [Alphaproteobacteria bacterium US3C007]|nr:hypothetical protein UM181_05010 [Alphaproteobacteria bacterium US3C007]